MSFETYPSMTVQYTHEPSRYYPISLDQFQLNRLHQQQVKPAPPSLLRLPSPPPGEPSITWQIASRATQKLISSQLRDVGFDSAQPLALQKLELETTALVRWLYEISHEYANLANRSQPIATDLLLASKQCGLEMKDLHKVGAMSKKRKGEDLEPISLLPPASRSPSPELLLSDDEDAAPVIPSTLHSLPSCLPALPPKHTYLRTPASPPKKAALPSLEKKLKTAGLVQESLKNLLLATEENFGHEDGELLGYIVNWEASTHPRKRWRVTA